ncbi:hypothetical protein WME98_50005 [Sorangium sp. So ce296]|uniref:hypothetical protein n=1 Tax=Sorangium sp. So ce296 TaxID=3133296 RepID=UPI003F61C55C
MTLSIDWLRDQVATYFEQNGIDAPVVYGTEQDYRDMDTSARVVIGLGDGFDLLPAGPSGAPGHRQVAPGHSSRSIGTKRQSFWVVVRAVPPPSVDDRDRVRMSQSLTSDLFDHVFRAIHKAAHGPHGLNINGKGKWLEVDEADDRHGAALRVTGTLDIPIDERPRTRLGLARAALDPTKVNIGLDLEACDSTVCTLVVSSP